MTLLHFLCMIKKYFRVLCLWTMTEESSFSFHAQKVTGVNWDKVSQFTPTVNKNNNKCCKNISVDIHLKNIIANHRALQTYFAVCGMLTIAKWYSCKTFDTE